MTWSRLDDNCIDHPKVLGLGDKAFRLWVCSIVYCSRHLTDGRLDESAIRLVAAHAGVESPDQRDRLVEELVKARLWDRAEDGGHSVHDYLDYNPSREKVLADREKRARAGRKGGRKSGRRRRQNKAPAEANAQASAQVGASGSAEANAQADAQGHFEPRPLASTKQGGDAAPAPGGAGGVPQRPDDVPPELSGLSPEQLREHRERASRRIAEALGGDAAPSDGGEA